MKTGVLVLDFYIEGCRSLKEKRRRISGIRARIGKTSNVAVCESDYQNTHKRAQFTFVAIASDGKVVDKTLASIEEYIQNSINARIIELHRSVR